MHWRAIGGRGLAVLLLVVAILWSIGLLAILLWLRWVGTVRLGGWRSTVLLLGWVSVSIRHVWVLGRVARLWGIALIVTST